MAMARRYHEVAEDSNRVVGFFVQVKFFFMFFFFFFKSDIFTKKTIHVKPHATFEYLKRLLPVAEEREALVRERRALEPKEQ